MAKETSSNPEQSTRGRFNPAGRRSFVILASFFGVVFVAATAVQMGRILENRSATVGDGENVETYQFDLSNLSVEREFLVASGLPRGGMPAMDDPEVYTAAEAKEVTGTPFTAPIVNTDRVIGVVRGGEARAYPLRFLRWHEIVNDTLGGEPIVVTFSPVSQGVAVFDRRVGGEVRRFRYSGLLYNQNLVMYDAGTESLWSQLKMEAIAGPAVEGGARLTLLPARLTTWERWREAHPETTLLKGWERFEERYENRPYDMNYRRGVPVMPVGPEPGEGHSAGLALSTLVAAWPDEDGEGWVAVADPQDHGERLPEGRAMAYGRWFVWYAMHGEGTRVIRAGAE